VAFLFGPSSSRVKTLAADVVAYFLIHLRNEQLEHALRIKHLLKNRPGRKLHRSLTPCMLGKSLYLTWRRDPSDERPQSVSIPASTSRFFAGLAASNIALRRRAPKVGMKTVKWPGADVVRSPFDFLSGRVRLSFRCLSKGSTREKTRRIMLHHTIAMGLEHIGNVKGLRARFREQFAWAGIEHPRPPRSSRRARSRRPGHRRPTNGASRRRGFPRPSRYRRR
jgi:hypothetical protein